ncbi:maltose acetyltransferase domain-containing protein [Paenibacillus lautus]|jgi:maltose O-acetyltransferase|nr:maltose acetyltransferase domain-containing protein [Paenibacillus lautus]
MSEKEKAAQGQLYNANYDPDILEERNYCKTLCFEYNQLPPTPFSERQEL